MAHFLTKDIWHYLRRIMVRSDSEKGELVVLATLPEDVDRLWVGMGELYAMCKGRTFRISTAGEVEEIDKWVHPLLR